jgi:hypothetical protein
VALHNCNLDAEASSLNRSICLYVGWRSHRPSDSAVTEHLNLAAILSHVGERVIGNDYTVSFADGRYHILRSEVQAGMRRQRLRVELRLNGELKARYQGR